jgi:hypothetical protein
MNERDVNKGNIMTSIIKRLRAFEGFLLLFSILAIRVWGTQRTVTTDIDSMPGSLRFIVDSAAAGDTIMFSFSGTDTAVLKSQILLSKDLVIIGKNAEMRGNVIVQGNTTQSVLLITNCNVELKTITLLNINTSIDSGGVLKVTGLSSKLQMDSVTITRGRAVRGGGVYINLSTVIMNNSRIINNSNCGIYNKSGALTMGNCVLSGNNGDNGSALANYAGTMTISNCSIANNNSSGNGGGIYNLNGTIILSGDTLFKNYTRNGVGGGIFLDSGNVSIANTVISNDSSYLGGGMYCVKGKVDISGCTFIHNVSRGFGGGIYNENADLKLANSTISNNYSSFYHTSKSLPAFSSSPQGTGKGGGIYNVSGRLSVKGCSIDSNFSKAVADNVVNAGNDLVTFSYSAYGGGIYNADGPVMIENSTVSNNASIVSATTGSSIVGLKSESYGGGIYNQTGSLTILNSTLSNNKVSSYAYTLSWSTRNEIQSGGAVCNISGTLMGVCATVAGNSDGIVGTSGLCYFLNSIIVNNTGNDFVWHDTSRAVHTLLGSGQFTHAESCSTGVGAAVVFPGPTPVLGYHSGTTKTLSLGSSSSIAFKAGIRAAMYVKETIFNTKYSRTDTILSAGFFDGKNWLSLETDSVVPSGTAVTEITADQRGVTRANPPCIGAFEYTAADAPVRYFPAVKRFFQSVSLIRNNLRIEFASTATANITLFDLSGRTLISRSVNAGPGASMIALPSLAPGPYVCRIKSPIGSITKKLIIQP